jgi:hypothetical protein
MVDYLREKIDLNILVDYSNTLFTNSKLWRLNSEIQLLILTILKIIKKEVSLKIYDEFINLYSSISLKEKPLLSIMNSENYFLIYYEINTNIKIVDQLINYFVKLKAS